MGQSVSLDAATFLQAVQEGQSAAIADVLSKDPTLARTDIAKVLIEAMTSILQRNHHFKLGHQQLQKELAALLNLRNVAGQTPLMLACDAKHLSVVKYLLEYGANPWLRDDLGRRTCLHYAAGTGGAAVVQAVLDFAAQNIAEMRTLHGAYTLERLQDMPSGTGFTPLHYAVWHGQEEVVNVLVKHGANINAANTASTVSGGITSTLVTPMHLAATRGNARIAKLLLRAYVDRLTGATTRAEGEPVMTDPRIATDRSGNTPWKTAVGLRHPESVLAVLQPKTPLSDVFADEHPTERRLGPPRLLELASAAAQPLLLQQVASILEHQAQLQTASSTEASAWLLSSVTETPQATEGSALEAGQPNPSFACLLPSDVATMAAAGGATPEPPASALAPAGSPFVAQSCRTMDRSVSMASPWACLAQQQPSWLQALSLPGSPPPEIDSHVPACPTLQVVHACLTSPASSVRTVSPAPPPPLAATTSTLGGCFSEIEAVMEEDGGVGDPSDAPSLATMQALGGPTPATSSAGNACTFGSQDGVRGGSSCAHKHSTSSGTGGIIDGDERCAELVEPSDCSVHSGKLADTLLPISTHASAGHLGPVDLPSTGHASSLQDALMPTCPPDPRPSSITGRALSTATSVADRAASVAATVFSQARAVLSREGAGANKTTAAARSQPVALNGGMLVPEARSRPSNSGTSYGGSRSRWYGADTAMEAVPPIKTSAVPMAATALSASSSRSSTATYAAATGGRGVGTPGLPGSATKAPGAANGTAVTPASNVSKGGAWPAGTGAAASSRAGAMTSGARRSGDDSEWPGLAAALAASLAPAPVSELPGSRVVAAVSLDSDPHPSSYASKGSDKVQTAQAQPVLDPLQPHHRRITSNASSGSGFTDASWLTPMSRQGVAAGVSGVLSPTSSVKAAAWVSSLPPAAAAHECCSVHSGTSIGTALVSPPQGQVAVMQQGDVAGSWAHSHPGAGVCQPSAALSGTWHDTYGLPTAQSDGPALPEGINLRHATTLRQALSSSRATLACLHQIHSAVKQMDSVDLESSIDLCRLHRLTNGVCKHYKGGSGSCECASPPRGPLVAATASGAPWPTAAPLSSIDRQSARQDAIHHVAASLQDLASRHVLRTSSSSVAEASPIARGGGGGGVLSTCSSMQLQRSRNGSFTGGTLPGLFLPQQSRASSLSGSIAGYTLDNGCDTARCGVCLQAQGMMVQMAPCGQQLCTDCAAELVGLATYRPALCPFCRAAIGGFAPWRSNVGQGRSSAPRELLALQSSGVAAVGINLQPAVTVLATPVSVGGC